MYLFGVTHNQEYFEVQISKIENICNTKGKSIMLELYPNYLENIEKGICKKSFFPLLAEYYEKRGNRIILGDQAPTIPENPDWILSMVLGENYFYPDNKRDEIMIQTIEREHPDIVIVGNGHADEIKQRFPDVNYIVFEPKGGYTAKWSHHGSPHIWNKPNRIITL